MGEGPFTVSLPIYGVSFKVCGPEAFSGIREMYVRDVYLKGGTLGIADGDTVVDLGANMGNFTNLALAHGKNVRVVAVEPSMVFNIAFQKSVGLNPRHLERTSLIRAFLGRRTEKQNRLLQDFNYADANWITEDELIRSANLTKIDFLKCDIEGGEFSLLNKNSKLLAMAKCLAIEIHAFAGNVARFIEELEACGLSVLAINWDPDGSCTLLAKRL